MFEWSNQYINETNLDTFQQPLNVTNIKIMPISTCKKVHNELLNIFDLLFQIRICPLDFPFEGYHFESLPYE